MTAPYPESRLRRQREKDLAELKQLQQERIAKRDARLKAAAHMCERFKDNEDRSIQPNLGSNFHLTRSKSAAGSSKAAASAASTPTSAQGD